VLDAFAAGDRPSDNLRPQKIAFDSVAWLGEPDGWQGEGWRLEHGDRIGGSATEGEADYDRRPLPVWAMQAPAAEADPPQPLAPSRLEAGEAEAAGAVWEPPVRSPLEADAADRFKRGILIHRLLQSLPELPAAERAGAAQRFLRLAGHGLDAEKVEAWTREALAVLDDPEARTLFAAGSRAEVPVTGIVQRNGRRHVVSGQVDRLGLGPGEITIVDYKTNRPPPRHPEEVALLYRRQMALYRAVLSQLYPDRTVRCFLLWTDGPRVMELPAPLLDAALR